MSWLDLPSWAQLVPDVTLNEVVPSANLSGTPGFALNKDDCRNHWSDSFVTKTTLCAIIVDK
jgi:hypothetical protein